MKTTAAVLRAADSPLTIEELEIGELRDGEVIVRLIGSGICHTDLGMIATLQPGEMPIVLGHEGSGIVEAVGGAVESLAAGDHVVLSYNSCGGCDHCTNNRPMYCRSFVDLNLSGTRLDGTTVLSARGQPVRGHFFGQSAWATRAVASETNCVKVSSDLPLELLGPLGCGVQTGAGAVLNTLRAHPGSSIVIFGMGSVGLAALLGAVVADCSTIIAVDIRQGPLQKATRLGATHTINSTSEDVPAAVREILSGTGSHYSVDCIGVASVVRDALECLQSPGACATVGFQGLQNEIVIDQGHLLFGRSLTGVIEGDAVPEDFITRMIDLYRDGRFPFDELITTFRFDEINEALDAVHTGDVTKGVLTFGDADLA